VGVYSLHTIGNYDGSAAPGRLMMPARIRLLPLLAGLLAAVLAFASPASAQPCAEQIIDDWSDNAEIDGTYPVECYRAAIAALPEDLRAYSSAADDIRRALQARLQVDGGSEDGGSSGGTAGSGGDSSGDSSGGSGKSTDVTSGGAGETQAVGDGQEDTLAGATEVDESALTSPAEVGSATPASDAFDRELGDGGASLPLPVIALIAAAGLAAVAVAGWLVIRRLHGRGGPAQ